jgi:branched-chain amino acid transport system ATP-binding protein
MSSGPIPKFERFILASLDQLLEIQDIHTYYGDSYVLQGISLVVEAGQIATLLGRNGMGKTTLIRSISGLTPPRQGLIKLKGTPLTGLPSYKIAQLGISLVPQGRCIFPSLTVRENLLIPTSSLAGQQIGTRGGASRWNLEKVMTEFPRLAERLKQFGGTLSGGEQQMLAIGRALMANPEIILMDEPSEGLAPVVVRHIGEIMRNIREQGHSILLVEQNFKLAMTVADFVYIISTGRIVYQGLPPELEKQKEILNRHLGI